MTPELQRSIRNCSAVASLHLNDGLQPVIVGDQTPISAGNWPCEAENRHTRLPLLADTDQAFDRLRR